MYKVFPFEGIRTWGGGDGRYNPTAFCAAVKKQKAHQPWRIRRLFRPKIERNNVSERKSTHTIWYTKFPFGM